MRVCTTKIPRILYISFKYKQLVLYVGLVFFPKAYQTLIRLLRRRRTHARVREELNPSRNLSELRFISFTAHYCKAVRSKYKLYSIGIII